VRGTGDLASLGTRAVAVVGARAATSYGEHVAAEFSYSLARADVTIVSGGAYGIDAAAHRGALAAGGQSVLVSAAGLDRPYPTGNAELFRRVAESGLLVSESPPGTAPHRHRFLTRNRLIAAFAAGTVVVEAARRSGAANTAAHCLAMGRVVMAVPGPVTSAMSAGCHALLRRESHPAVLVTGAREVLDAVGFGAHSQPAEQAIATNARQRAIDGLDPTARRVFDGLTLRDFATPAAIARRCGVAVPDVVRALPMLELAGLLDCVDGGYRARSRVAP
jgi:DNA processing protein